MTVAKAARNLVLDCYPPVDGIIPAEDIELQAVLQACLIDLLIHAYQYDRDLQPKEMLEKDVCVLAAVIDLSYDLGYIEKAAHRALSRAIDGFTASIV